MTFSQTSAMNLQGSPVTEVQSCEAEFVKTHYIMRIHRNKRIFLDKKHVIR